ncbi:MAG: hypothetical protein AB1896_18500 [Thermodesulfobacteriota bacterium]
MEFWETFYRLMDAWLMPAYRLPPVPLWGFYLGTLVLALGSVLLGELAYGLALRADRKQVARYRGEVVRLNNLSLAALEAGDRESYRAANHLANEAFGRMFFLQAALSLASLWPLPFALAWMQYRFFEVEFPLPLTGFSLGYTGPFLLLYILLRIGFGGIKSRLPFFRGSARIFQELVRESGRMRSWRELWPNS